MCYGSRAFGACRLRGERTGYRLRSRIRIGPEHGEFRGGVHGGRI